MQEKGTAGGKKKPKLMIQGWIFLHKCKKKKGALQMWKYVVTSDDKYGILLQVQYYNGSF